MLPDLTNRWRFIIKTYMGLLISFAFPMLFVFTTFIACNYTNKNNPANKLDTSNSQLQETKIDSVNSKQYRRILGAKNNQNLIKEGSFQEVINVRSYGAKGNGVNDDTRAINKAIAELQHPGTTLYFPNGVYIITGSGISLHGKNVKLIGESVSGVILRGQNAKNIINIDGDGMQGNFTISNITFYGKGIGSSIRITNIYFEEPSEISECKFVGSAHSFVYLNNVEGVSIENNLFKGNANGEGTGIYIINGCHNISIQQNKLFHLYNGLYVVGMIQRGHGARKELTKVNSNSNISFKGNYVDLAWYLLPFRFSGEGVTVRFTENSISDSRASFADLKRYENLRVLETKFESVVGRVTEGVLIDPSARFKDDGIEPKCLIRSNGKIALITKVLDNHTLAVENWLDIENNLSFVAPPKNGSTYSIEKLMLAKILKYSEHKIIVNRFISFNGDTVVPKRGWRYEVLNHRPNYPVHVTPNNVDIAVEGNHLKRGWSDQISFGGEEGGTIIANIIEDGQDMGITVNGRGNTVKNNRITHQGVSGIWVNCSKSIIEANHIMDAGWWYQPLANAKPDIGFITVTSRATNNVLESNITRRVNIQNGAKIGIFNRKL